MNKLNKFFQLSYSDRKLFLFTFFLLWSIKIGIALLPFKTLRDILAQITKIKTQPNNQELISVNKVVWSVKSASNYVFGGKNCLVQALATQTLLILQQHNALTRIGSKWTIDGKLQVHAWVEVQNRIIIGNLNNISLFQPILVLSKELKPILSFEEQQINYN